MRNRISGGNLSILSYLVEVSHETGNACDVKIYLLNGKAWLMIFFFVIKFVYNYDADLSRLKSILS